MSATWKIVACDYSKSLGGEEDVITNVHYEVVDEETVEEDIFYGRTYGSVGIDTSDLSDFTPYDSITEDILIDWVKTVLEEEAVAAAETYVADQIAEEKSPTTGTGVPW